MQRHKNTSNVVAERAGNSGTELTFRPALAIFKYIITCDTIFYFLKFVIKVNVFWQQLVTSTSKNWKFAVPAVSIIDRIAPDQIPGASDNEIHDFKNK